MKHQFQEAKRLLNEAMSYTPGSYKLHRLRAVAEACLQDYTASLAVRTSIGALKQASSLRP